MFNGLRNQIYKGTLAEKDAEELKQRLGFKDEILSYLGGEDPTSRKIPNRKSAYEILYDKLVEKLEDSEVLKLAAKKELFLSKRNVSVLWEDFEEKVMEKETNKKIELEKQIKEEVHEVERKLQKLKKLKEKMIQKEEQLLQELKEKKNVLNTSPEQEIVDTITVEADEVYIEKVEGEVLKQNTKEESKIELKKELKKEPKLEEVEPEVEPEVETEVETEVEPEVETEVETEVEPEVEENAAPFNPVAEEPELTEEQLLEKFDKLESIVLEQ